MKNTRKTCNIKSKKLAVSAKKGSRVGYDKDYCLWISRQTKFLQTGDFDKLDITNLVEEIESLGKSERRALESQLEILLMHILKKKYQPWMASRSWELSVKESRLRASRILKENLSLKPELEQFVKDAYQYARLEAAKETGLDEKIFPKACELTIKEILG